VTAKPVVPREQANRDVEQAVDFYRKEAGAAVAFRFINALEKSYRAIGANPPSGSPRYAFELNFPSLRSLTIKSFPYLIFYVERYDHVDIWRILHAQRDIPASMSDPDSTHPR
jgi:toxin ParE1/3/4